MSPEKTTCAWSLNGAPWLHPRWQPVANRIGTQAADPREPVAVSCDPLPIAAHGKDGVSGSSPEEGSVKRPRIAGPFGKRSGAGGTKVAVANGLVWSAW